MQPTKTDLSLTKLYNAGSQPPYAACKNKQNRGVTTSFDQTSDKFWDKQEDVSYRFITKRKQLTRGNKVTTEHEDNLSTNLIHIMPKIFTRN